MSEKIVRHLRNLIRNASTNYRNGFAYNDVKLTEEFKAAYSDYLARNKQGYSIDFNDYTAVVTTSSDLQIFIPNQWFAMSAYAKEVCRELWRYKTYFDQVVQYTGANAYNLANALRGTEDKKEIMKFSKSLREILEKESDKSVNEDTIEEAVKYITQFATNYDWWSGSKTINRTDFHISVILNMLGLVNVSQGYVADIVYAYFTDEKLDSITDEVASFTVDLGGSTWKSYDDSHDSAYDEMDCSQDTLIDVHIEKPVYNVIHISGKKQKEIRIKT